MGTDKVVEDAKEAAKEAKQLAQEWCDNGCTSTVARFLEGIFRAMHGGKCNDASVFCGACQKRAAKYFQQNDLPCLSKMLFRRALRLTNMLSTTTKIRSLNTLLISEGV